MTTSKATFPRKRKPTYVLKLPWPPSINHYYGTTRNGQRFIAKKGQEFRRIVIDACKEIPDNFETLNDRLQVWIECFPPDRRRRDLDNLKKALLDALTHAGVYTDDCLIDDVRAVRREVEKPGHVIVHIGKLSDG